MEARCAVQCMKRGTGRVETSRGSPGARQRKEGRGEAGGQREEGMGGGVAGWALGERRAGQPKESPGGRRRPERTEDRRTASADQDGKRRTEPVVGRLGPGRRRGRTGRRGRRLLGRAGEDESTRAGTAGLGSPRDLRERRIAHASRRGSDGKRNGRRTPGRGVGGGEHRRFSRRGRRLRGRRVDPSLERRRERERESARKGGERSACVLVGREKENGRGRKNGDEGRRAGEGGEKLG